ncbi:unnamed protein product [Closterium sp. Naga37s-1]|nr:unnamed protein product [Closterium sp. Naga37s-1]
MRIVIEVDVSAEEITLATHLFSALRAIADDVRARNLRPVFEALIARLRDPAELDSVARDVRTLLGEGAGVGESGEKGGARGSGGGSKSGSGNGEEKEGAADGAKANEDPLDAFVAAFLHVVFETDLLAQKISVVPFMRLVPRLPDTAKVKMRDTLIPKILKFLTIKRPPDASRAEFFVHAEAFAALVHLEFVSIQGAVTTILTLLRKPDNRCTAIRPQLPVPVTSLPLPSHHPTTYATPPGAVTTILTLLRKPDNRCAAVTMLGKTVELCAPQLVAQGDPGKMEELRKAVLGLKEEAFRYDVNYVRDSLGWTDNPIATSPAPAATAAPPAIPPATAALSAGAAATAALAAAGSSPAPLSAPLPPSHAPLPPSQPPLPPPQPPLPLAQPSRQSPMAVTAPAPLNPPVSTTHQMQTQGLGQGQGQAAAAAAPPPPAAAVAPQPPPALAAGAGGAGGAGGGGGEVKGSGATDPMQSSPSQSTVPSNNPTMLVPLDSFHGHQHTILAVGVDGNSGATWSAAMDGSLIMWGGDGKPRQSLLLGSHYVCGMDLLYSPSSLLLAAAPRDDMSEGQAASNPVAPCILQLTGDEGAGAEEEGTERWQVLAVGQTSHSLSSVYPLPCCPQDDMSEGQAAANPVAPCILQLTGDEGAGGVTGGAGGGGGGGWQVTGRLDRNQTSVISYLAFITAESMAPSDGSAASPRDRICCYDLAGAPFSSLHPVRQYTEHEDLITCLTVFPPNPNLFLSASRDATIRLWDRRASNAVALLGSPSPSGRPQAHAGMVTALDACPASVTIASGGMDGYLKLWDLRSLHSLGNSPPLGSLNLDESPILKLASSMLPGVVAVSTVRGLYLADLSGSVGPSGGGGARLAGGFQDGRQPGRYHDIKWAHGRRLLFAGGDAMRVDVYGLQ